MRFGTKALASLCLVAVVVLVAMPNAAATTYTVNANPYSATNSISILSLWDSYELTASSGSHVAYSVSVTGSGCVMLLLAKGHSVTTASTYYILYSQENCVSSYSNSFPVGSNDGTDFSVLVLTTSTTAVSYTVNINVQAPSALETLLIVVALVIIVAVVVVVLLLVRRRKAARVPPPPMMPPPYQPMPPQMPPQQPPQQPPLQP